MSEAQPVLRRHALAFIAAPFVAATVWAVTAFLWLVCIDGLTAARADLPSLLVGTPLIALPVAVALVLFVAGPVYAAVESWGKLTRPTVLAAGIAIGAIVPSVARGILSGLSLINGVNGAVIGCVTAWVWWIIAEGTARGPSSAAG